MHSFGLFLNDSSFVAVVGDHSSHFKPANQLSIVLQPSRSHTHQKLLMDLIDKVLQWQCSWSHIISHVSWRQSLNILRALQSFKDMPTPNLCPPPLSLCCCLPPLLPRSFPRFRIRISKCFSLQFLLGCSMCLFMVLKYNGILGKGKQRLREAATMVFLNPVFWVAMPNSHACSTTSHSTEGWPSLLSRLSTGKQTRKKNQVWSVRGHTCLRCVPSRFQF